MMDQPTGCCPRTEELLVKYGDRELCDSYLRICRNLEQFYEYEYRGNWGTDWAKEADLLGLLNDICTHIDSLEPPDCVS